MKDIITAILIIAVLVLVLEPKKETKPIVVTKYDTIVEIKNIVKYKRGESIPFVVLDTIVKIDEIHDTIRIISDYNRIYAYYDTLKLDSAQYVYVNDTISQNKILGRGYGGYFNNHAQRLSWWLICLLVVQALCSDRRRLKQSCNKRTTCICPDS